MALGRRGETRSNQSVRTAQSAVWRHLDLVAGACVHFAFTPHASTINHYDFANHADETVRATRQQPEDLQLIWTLSHATPSSTSMRAGNSSSEQMISVRARPSTLLLLPPAAYLPSGSKRSARSPAARAAR